MYVSGVRDIYLWCRNLGISRSLKDYSRNIVGGGDDYVRNVLRRTDTRHRTHRCPPWVGSEIIKNLRSIHEDLDGGPARDVAALIAIAEDHVRRAKALSRN